MLNNVIRVLRDPNPPAGGGGANPPAGGTPPAGGAATITPELLNGLQGDAFRNVLPEDIRTKGYMKDVNTFGDFVKKFDGAQALMGQRAVPADNASAEEWNKWFDTIGRQEKPEAYGVPAVDGVPPEYATEASKALSTILHASGLNTMMAKTALSNIIKQTYAAEQAEKAADEKAYDKLMNDTFGQNRQAIQENGKKYIAAMAPASVQPLLANLPNEAWAVLLAATDAMARKFGQEDSFRGGAGSGAGGTGAETEETLKGQMRTIMAQKEYQDPFANKTKHAELNAQMEAIRAKLAKIYNKV